MPELKNYDNNIQPKVVQLQQLLEEVSREALDIYLRLEYLRREKALPINQDLLYLQSRLLHISKVITVDVFVEIDTTQL